MTTAVKGEADELDPVLDERRLLTDALRYCVPVFLGLRLLTFVIGLAAVGIVPPLDPVGVPGWPANPIPDPGWQNLFTAWERFDALWFLRIADAGYRTADGSAAFFPLYPLAVRTVSFVLGGHPFAASILVVERRLPRCARRHLPPDHVRDRRARRPHDGRAPRLLPDVLFLPLPYSESTFLLLAVTAFWGARRGRWGLAGVAGVLAALTRSVGLVLAPALAIEALHRRAEGRGPAWPGLLAAAATGLGTLAYLGWWELRTGDWLTPVTRQENWERTFSWPWVSLWNATRSAGRYVGNTNGGYWIIDWVIVVPVLVLSVWAWKRYRPSYGLYLWGGLLIPLTFVFDDRPSCRCPASSWCSSPCSGRRRSWPVGTRSPDGRSPRWGPPAWACSAC